jgi:uncharacterized protein DUF4349
MRLRKEDMPLDPDAERELGAVEAGLLGLDVAPDLEDLAELARDTRAQAPAPDSGFAARLDEWAAAGFPRDGRAGDGGVGERGPVLRTLRERLQSTPPRRLLLPVGAAATLLVAAAVGISVSDQVGGPSQTGSSVQAAPGTLPESSKASGDGSGGATSGARAYGQATDRVRRAPEAGVPNIKELEPTVRPAAPQALGDLTPQGGPRKVAQTADLVLSTEPQDVRDVADGVVGVVDRYGGYVVSSNVTSGKAPAPTPVPLDAGANGGRSPQGSGTFELRIPAQHLQAALGDLSKLAHVTSRTEGVKDITKRFDDAKARVHDLNVERAHLLRQLADATTLTERQSLKVRLQVVENQLASARDHYGHVQDRIRMVPVSVEIHGQAGVNAGGGGGWGIDDAFRDAGRVLTVIAGILLISLAVLVPIGLIGGLAWLTARAVIRKRREDALE